MPSTSSSVETHVAEMIAATDLSEEPFPHCVVDDVFPPDVFSAIHENWPTDDELVPLPDTGRTNAYPQRHVMVLYEPYFSRMTQAKRDFWVQIAEVAMGRLVVRECCKKFRRVLRKRTKHINEPIELSSEMLVVSDRANYSIGPHTDSPERFVSLLYYLSPESKYASYGTRLYEPINPDKHDNPSKHYEFEDFTLRRIVEYKPNRLVIFPRTETSYHGVEAVDVEDCDRRLLIVNIRAPKEAIRV